MAGVSRSKQAVFVDENATTTQGYYLTELKAATFHTVDCVGQKNRWNETIVQLWVAEDEENDEFMIAEKFLSIYDRVSGMIALNPEAEIRFELRGRELRHQTTMSFR